MSPVKSPTSPGLVSGSKIGSDKTRSDQTGSDKIRSSQAGSDKTRFSQTKSKNTRPSQTGSDKTTLDQTGNDKTRSHETGSNKTRSTRNDIIRPHETGNAKIVEDTANSRTKGIQSVSDSPSDTSNSNPITSKCEEKIPKSTSGSISDLLKYPSRILTDNDDKTSRQSKAKYPHQVKSSSSKSKIMHEESDRTSNDLSKGATDCNIIIDKELTETKLSAENDIKNYEKITKSKNASDKESSNGNKERTVKVEDSHATEIQEPVIEKEVTVVNTIPKDNTMVDLNSHVKNEQAGNAAYANRHKEKCVVSITETLDKGANIDMGNDDNLGSNSALIQNLQESTVNDPKDKESDKANVKDSEKHRPETNATETQQSSAESMNKEDNNEGTIKPAAARRSRDSTISQSDDESLEGFDEVKNNL